MRFVFASNNSHNSFSNFKQFFCPFYSFSFSLQDEINFYQKKFSCSVTFLKMCLFRYPTRDQEKSSFHFISSFECAHQDNIRIQMILIFHSHEKNFTSYCQLKLFSSVLFLIFSSPLSVRLSQRVVV